MPNFLTLSLPVSETVKAPRYLASFGPVKDNVVVPENLLEEMEKPDSSFAKYDLLFGLINNEGKFSSQEKLIMF